MKNHKNRHHKSLIPRNTLRHLNFDRENFDESSKGFTPTAGKRQAGFTIIEVMIVLVIAATVILIVFLAVPALQRNSRNNNRKNDAARVLAAAEEWRSHNSNQLPHCDDMQGRTADTIPPCATRTAIEDLAGKLAHYQNIWSVNYVEYPGFMTADNSLTQDQNVIALVGDSVLVRTKTKCAEPSKLENGSGMVVLYSQETPSGIVLACRG